MGTGLGQLTEEGNRKLKGFYETLNPVEIRRRLEDNLHKLWILNG